jgi:hypothetical protein
MEGDNTFTCDMVIARYKEDLQWLIKYQDKSFRNVYIYNKSEGDNTKTGKDIGCIYNGKECIKVDLANEGRCDHTYLHHIVSNYDNLADVTIFTKGSSDMHREKKKLAFTVDKVFETKDTVMSVDNHPTALHIHAKDFQMNSYRASHPKNHHGIYDIHGHKMKPASPRPFGKWFEKHFPGVTIYKAIYSGVFSVARKHIHQHPKSYYQMFLKELEGHSNPEVGHYIERSWVAIFHPIPDNCLYDSLISELKYRGGSRRKQTRKNKRRPKRSRSFKIYK